MANKCLHFYTVMNWLGQDYEGAFEKIARCGFETVSFAGPKRLPARKVRELLKENGLAAENYFTTEEDINSSISAEIEYAREIGAETLTCCTMRVDDLETLLHAAKILNQTGDLCRENGLRFCYHNHAPEFWHMGDTTILERLMQETDPDKVGFEFDTFWAEYADIDAAKFIRQYHDRIKIIDIRQMKSRDTKTGSSLRSGCIDIEKIIRTGEEYGINIYPVLQKIPGGVTEGKIAEDAEFLQKFI